MVEYLNIQDEYLQILIYFKLLSNIVFSFIVSFYLILNLQWYSYKINRVIFKHHKQRWHILFFIFPIVLHLIGDDFFWLFFYFIYLPLFLKWYGKLDKKIQFTQRVIRYFIYVFVLSVMSYLVAFVYQIDNSQILILFILPISIIAMSMNEKVLFIKYKKQAIKKLAKMDKLIIIQITASFGKTSIKNFIYQYLKEDFNILKTPKSVNTLSGIIQDINNNLTLDTQIYIAESGAREKNDILDIVNVLNPQYVVLGKIGDAHLEYFKTKENIISTKSKILTSKRLKKAYINISNNINPAMLKNISFQTYPKDLKIISSSLDGVTFSLKLDNKINTFHTKLLGELNPENLSVALMIANDFGVKLEKLKETTTQMPFVPHRLEKIVSHNKIILDDSYNSNYDGMLQAIHVVKNALNVQNKIIVTCGLVESSDEINIKLIKEIDKVFNIVIVTGELNKKLFDLNIKKAQKLTLKDKSKLKQLLSVCSKSGDIILFANDAPNYI